ncbi:hypothetical protein [Pedococcus sp. 5OH_020]|uniref:hypothetical protein n=1 Tax=Pedococcus sp. 5OH_020 TaxID=2989814 RepID=UPI0022E9FFE2|nr:hypothetical protein [Pedococcus sp. 5OH_020]
MADIDPAPELHDSTLEEEIELLGDLLEAVAQAHSPLGQAEVDQALGVDGSHDGAHHDGAPRGHREPARPPFIRGGAGRA